MNNRTFFLRFADGRVATLSRRIASLVMAGAITANALGAVTSRQYNFEQGSVGGTTTTASDVITNLLITGTGPRAGLFWVEVPGPSPRPLPAGNLQDSVAMSGLAAPQLQAEFGNATYADVTNGSPFDSPAVGSQKALQFSGASLFSDINTAPGTRGVFVDQAAYAANDPLDAGNNAFENFSVISQAWVRPNSAGMGSYQTVYQVGGEQGSINITTDGFWEAANMGSVGLFTTTIPVAFNAWTHVGLFRGGNGAELYINGVLVAGDRNPTPAQNFGAFASIIAVGGDELGSGLFNGLVDDFKIMGTADGSVDARIDMDYWDRIIPCDFNNDTLCNVDDLNAMLQLGPIAPGVAATPQTAIYDVNEDGVINTADRTAWLASAATQNGLGSPYKIGDANLDGSVDGSDFGLWNSNKFTSALNWNQGDFNQDGAIDGSDFGLWNGNKFTSSDGSLVPEPASASLICISVLGILLRGYSSRRTAS